MMRCDPGAWDRFLAGKLAYAAGALARAVVDVIGREMDERARRPASDNGLAPRH